MVKNYNASGDEIDLTGRLLEEKDFPELYRIIDRIEEAKDERNNQGNH